VSRLVSVVMAGERRAGVLEGDQVWVTDLPGLDAAFDLDIELDSLHHRAGRWVPLDGVRLDAPLRPHVVFCLGQNYRDHLDEKGPVTVTEPEFFLKAGQTVSAPDAPCVLEPKVTNKLDYETELGVVIGRTARQVSPEQALGFVAGYLVVNDLTARDRQVVRHEDGTVTFALGPAKNFDGATRMGPWLTTAADVRDPQRLSLRTTVNGQLRQLNSTASMIFPVAELISFLSRLLTLRPGTVISTGTPGGTGWGTDAAIGGTGRVPQGCVPARYLAAGDEVTGTIEHVGVCSFTVCAPAGRPNGPADAVSETIEGSPTDAHCSLGRHHRWHRHRRDRSRAEADRCPHPRRRDRRGGRVPSAVCAP
jgi:2-keto-4-pentenoate hydratase/2-oxohepta-3-ene-1,7-dioic acid hydratase in catechol pathway